MSSPVTWVVDKWNSFFLEVDDETDFPETLDELKVQLTTTNPGRAQAILSEAQAACDRMQDRIDGAERRATTLQGSSAVAASLALTGSALLIDPSKIHDVGWRLGFGLVLAFVTLAFVLCAYRATLASTRVHVWFVPTDRDLLKRPSQDVSQAQTERAAELLHAIGKNMRNARWKVAMMRASAEWLARALLGLLLVALLAVVYIAAGPGAMSPQPAPSMAVTASRSGGAPGGALVERLQAAISTEAREAVKAGSLKDSIIRTVCDPVGRNLPNMHKPTREAFKCVAVTRTGGGSDYGYRYTGRVDFGTGSYSWHLGGE
jgi:hypothetical protein